VTTMGITTDLYPTFLDAAGLSAPGNVKLDGISLLPLLVANSKEKRKIAKKSSSERVGLWHNDFEGPKASVIWIFDFKVMLDGKD
jgi:arylsulfatase A-like enzyme